MGKKRLLPGHAAKNLLDLPQKFMKSPNDRTTYLLKDPADCHAGREVISLSHLLCLLFGKAP